MFKLNLLTPEKKIVIDLEVDEVTLPAQRGELDILPGHSPLMTTLGAGIMKFRPKGQEMKKMAISWGYCQVSPEGVNVLAEFLLTVDEAKPEQAHKNLSSIDNRLLNEFLSDEEFKALQQEKGRYSAEIELSSQSH